jgi:hypothetical protein
MNRNEFFQALPVARLNLKLTSATLEICTDDIDDIHVMASGGKTDMEELQIAFSADTLTVEQPLSRHVLKTSAAGSWLQLAIRLPRSWKGAIDARSVSGWMNLRGVNGTDLSLDTVSGLIMISDAGFLTISARAVTGDVKLNQVSCGKCGLFSTSGDLTCMRTALNAGSASTVTGMITLDLAEPFGELSLNSVTGELRVDAPIAECDATLRSVSGRIRTDGVSIVEGAARLRATTVSSDLDLVCTLD